MAIMFKSDLLILLFCVAVCLHGTTALTLTEGEGGTFNLPYPCEAKEVALSYEEKAPFYKSTHPGLINLSSKFLVTNHNVSQSGNCSLHLSINNATRFDEGNYFLSTSENGQLTQFYLHVEPMNNVSPTSTDPWSNFFIMTDTTPQDPLSSPLSNISTSKPAQTQVTKQVTGHPRVRGSTRSVMSDIVICFFSLYVLLMICLAIFMMMFRWDTIFNYPAHDAGRGLAMEGYKPPEPQASKSTSASYLHDDREKNVPLMTQL